MNNNLSLSMIIKYGFDIKKTMSFPVQIMAKYICLFSKRLHFPSLHRPTDILQCKVTLAVSKHSSILL